jgi:hypothetical protein
MGKEGLRSARAELVNCCRPSTMIQHHAAMPDERSTLLKADQANRVYEGRWQASDPAG